MGVYCTAWTYFGSIGRAASAGLWFLPIYLGPTLGMLVAWMLLRKMIRIARVNRITSIADFIGSRYGKSRLLAALVTLIAVVGIVPYVALQLKAIATGYSLLTSGQALPGGSVAGAAWWRDSTLYIALVLAGFTIAFGTRHLDTTERHEGMVAAIAVESIVKLLAFLAIGAFVTWGLFDGPGDIFTRASARPDLKPLLGLGAENRFAGGQWFALTLLSMLSLFFLPRQFQMMVVENVDERHVRRAAWAFPLYLLLINLFVLPIALGGLLHPASAGADAETFVLSLPLATGHPVARAPCLRRRALGGDRDDHRRGDRGLDDGLQRPHDPAAAARRARAGARPDRHAARHPPRRHRRAAAARLPLLPDRRRGLRARQHRPDQLRRGRAVRHPRCWAACTGRAARAPARSPASAPASCSGSTR